MTASFRIKAPHEPDSGDLLNLRKGACLEFERRPTEWEGWIWCKSPEGASGWVPEAWVTVEGRNCIMLRDYVSRELKVEVGEVVEGQLIESGWAWVRTGDGVEGWVPVECLEEMEKQE